MWGGRLSRGMLHCSHVDQLLFPSFLGLDKYFLNNTWLNRMNDDSCHLSNDCFVLGFTSINFNCHENPAKSVTQMAGCSGSSADSRSSAFDTGAKYNFLIAVLNTGKESMVHLRLHGSRLCFTSHFPVQAKFPACPWSGASKVLSECMLLIFHVKDPKGQSHESGNTFPEWGSRGW